MTREELLKLSVLINDVNLFSSLIIDKALDLDWSDNDGRTVLHWAAIVDGGLQYAKILLNYGANPSIKDKAGYTPLALAETMKIERSIEFFKKVGVEQPLISRAKHSISIKPISVIVIGAGVSGLQAAVDLTRSGHKVTMLEARGRIGGRICTERLKGGISVELGCNFIHGPGGNPLTPLLKKYHIDFEPISPASTAIFDPEGHLIDLEHLSPLTEKIKSKIFSSNKKRLSDAADYSLTTPESAFVNNFREMARNEAGYTPHRKHSLLSYKLGYTLDHVGGNYLITNGYCRLPQSLMAEARDTGLFDLKMETVVKRISDRRDKVFVETDNGTEYEADYVICTVPLRVLDYILFEPGLSVRKKESMDRLGMAVHDKIILEFECAFWPEDIDYLLPYDSEAEIWREIVNLHHFSKGKTATLIVSNYLKLTQLKKSEKELIADSLNMLKGIFGGKMTKLKSSIVTHWYDDPFARGSYSYHTEKSSLEDNSILAEPQGRVFFAGEHTSHFPSSLDGAYLSGIQVAKDIVDRIGE